MSALRHPLAQTCVILLVITSMGPLWISGQTQSKSASSGTKPTAQPAPSSQQAVAPPTSIQSKIAADVAASRDLGDYVPCEFSRADLLNLRPQPAIYTLTDADEDALRSKIIADALDSANAGAFPETADRDAFVTHISEASFVGLTSSQATGKVLYLLGQDTAPSTEVSSLLDAASKDNETFASFLEQNYQIPSEEAMQRLGESAQPPNAKLSVAMNLAQNKLAQATPEEINLLTAATLTNKDFSQYLSKTYDLTVTDLGNESQSPESKLDLTAKAATSTGKGTAQKTATDAKQLASAQDLSKNASQSTKVLTQGPAKNQVAQAAQQATAAIARPLDVACSMSILSYETTRYAFGQRMADEFIPVQIVVRNLNANKEFLVQDAQLAVDEDINGRLGRYAGGVDKLTARTFMLSSRDYSHRNLVVHIAEGVGTVLSSASLVYGTAVKDAANVYSAGFLNALTGVWTDHGTDQLNLLNDEGFSSYRTERTVVPKSGTAEFVIFFKSDQFQEGWWTQGCAENIVIQNPNQISQVNARQSARCIGQYNLQSPDPKCIATANISVDLDAARRVCLHFYKDPANRSDACSNSDTACEPKLVDIGTDDKDVTGAFAYFKPTSVPYKKWSPRAIALFGELSIAVIAGTHIQEETSTTPSLTKVSCPQDSKGDIDFDKADGSDINCPLTGTNLDQVDTLKLRNAADVTDTTTATATVTTTTTGGSKTTTAAFSMDSLGKLSAKAYKVYTVTKDGVEGGGNLTINLSTEPYLPAAGKPDPNTLDLATLLGKNGKPIPITLKGYHLDTLGSVRFAKSPSDKTMTTVTSFDVAVDSGATAIQAQITVKPDDVKKAKITGDFTTQKLELSLALISKAAPNAPIATKQVIYGSGNLTPAPAKKPAAAPKVKNGKQ